MDAAARVERRLGRLSAHLGAALAGGESARRSDGDVHSSSGGIGLRAAPCAAGAPANLLQDQVLAHATPFCGFPDLFTGLSSAPWIKTGFRPGFARRALLIASIQTLRSASNVYFGFSVAILVIILSCAYLHTVQTPALVKFACTPYL